MILLRKTEPVLAGSQTEFLNAGNDHIFAYRRDRGDGELIALVNVTEQQQTTSLLNTHEFWFELISGGTVTASGSVVLEPYQVMWLQPIRQ